MGASLAAPPETGQLLANRRHEPWGVVVVALVGGGGFGSVRSGGSTCAFGSSVQLLSALQVRNSGRVWKFASNGSGNLAVVCWTFGFVVILKPSLMPESLRTVT